MRDEVLRQVKRSSSFLEEVGSASYASKICEFNIIFDFICIFADLSQRFAHDGSDFEYVVIQGQFRNCV